MYEISIRQSPPDWEVDSSPWYNLADFACCKLFSSCFLFISTNIIVTWIQFFLGISLEFVSFLSRVYLIHFTPSHLRTTIHNHWTCKVPSLNSSKGHKARASKIKNSITIVEDHRVVIWWLMGYSFGSSNLVCAVNMWPYYLTLRWGKRVLLIIQVSWWHIPCQ